MSSIFFLNFILQLNQIYLFASRAKSLLMTRFAQNSNHVLELQVNCIKEINKISVLFKVNFNNSKIYIRIKTFYYKILEQTFMKQK